MKPSSSCLCCGSHNTTRQFFTELDASGRVVIADLEAGLNDLIWANPQADDVVGVPSRQHADGNSILGEARSVRDINHGHGLGPYPDAQPALPVAGFTAFAFQDQVHLQITVPGRATSDAHPA